MWNLMSNFHDFTSHFRVLGGIVLILLIVALSTCIKNRRNILMVSTTATANYYRLPRPYFLNFLRIE